MGDAVGWNKCCPGWGCSLRAVWRNLPSSFMLQETSTFLYLDDIIPSSSSKDNPMSISFLVWSLCRQSTESSSHALNVWLVSCKNLCWPRYFTCLWEYPIVFTAPTWDGHEKVAVIGVTLEFWVHLRILGIVTPTWQVSSQCVPPVAPLWLKPFCR